MSFRPLSFHILASIATFNFSFFYYDSFVFNVSSFLSYVSLSFLSRVCSINEYIYIGDRQSVEPVPAVRSCDCYQSIYIYIYIYIYILYIYIYIYIIF